ncbi:M15 family metallopeptidase [Sanguibacter sp. 25GB23B1]|uniref:M15 family metallopeptidase n=1 Tax=unclassified Sanguibacter TaxID=2645534 RepID=UPI0032AF8151
MDNRAVAGDSTAPAIRTSPSNHASTATRRSTSNIKTASNGKVARNGKVPANRPSAGARQQAPVSAAHRWIPRAAVLTSLAVATIALPLSAGAGGGSGSGSSSTLLASTPEAPAVPVGPSTLEIVANGVGDVTPPPSLAQAVPAEQRTVQAASRSETRTPLPGCDSAVEAAGTNGNLSKSTLCELWGTGNYLRGDAAVSIAALNEAYVSEYGVNMCITDSYRTLSSQYSLKSAKGGLAATPGKSEHGWGLAVDFCPETYQSTAKWKWLKANGPLYGWDNPAWARPGGSGATEPWHWEFTEGVESRD